MTARLTPAELLLGEMAMSSLALLELVREQVDMTDARTINVAIQLGEQIDRAAELIRQTNRRQEAALN